MKILTIILAILCLDRLITAPSVLEKIGYTLLKIITLGGFFVWWVWDIVQLIRNKYEVKPMHYLI